MKKIRENKAQEVADTPGEATLFTLRGSHCGMSGVG
jgi:hypothetical protein